MTIGFPVWLIPAEITLAACGLSSIMTFGYVTSYQPDGTDTVRLLVWLFWAVALAVSATAWAVYFAVTP